MCTNICGSITTGSHIGKDSWVFSKSSKIKAAKPSVVPHKDIFFQQALQLSIPKEKTDGAPYWVIVQLTQ